MFHARHFLLAARPRASTARRLALFLLVVLSLAAGAPFAAAEMVYYTEDFCNDGKLGFDPMFNHELTSYDPQDTWRLTSRSWGCQLELYGVSDTITFNLAEGQQAVYASVEAPFGWFVPGHGSIEFIGSEGVWETSASDHGTYFFAISSAEIGQIQSIVLYNTQGAFMTVRIGVVPEPGVTLLMLGGLVPATAVRRRFRKTT